MDDGPSEFISPFAFIAIVGFGLYLFRKSFAVVPSHHVAVVERFGNNPRVIHPGFHWLGWPLIDRIKELRLTLSNDKGGKTVTRSDYVPVREMNMDIQPMSILTSDNVPITVDATLYVKVVDPIMFLYTHDDPGEFVNDVCMNSFNTFLSEKPVSVILKSTREITDMFMASVAPQIKDLGIVPMKVFIQSIRIPEALRKAYETKVTNQVESEASLQKQKADDELNREKARAAMSLERERELQRLELNLLSARNSAESNFAFEVENSKLTSKERADYLVSLAQASAMGQGAAAGKANFLIGMGGGTGSAIPQAVFAVNSNSNNNKK